MKDLRIIELVVRAELRPLARVVVEPQAVQREGLPAEATNAAMMLCGAYSEWYCR